MAARSLDRDKDRIYKWIMPARMTLLWLLLGPGLALAAAPSRHIDTEAGVQFDVPFPIYDTKTGQQLANLIDDRLVGKLADNVTYSSAVYADHSDKYIAIWRQPFKELPTRYQFRRIQYVASLGAQAHIEDASIIESIPAAIFSWIPEDGKKDKVAQIAMVLTKEENIFIGLFADRSRLKEIKSEFATIVGSLDIDPSRKVSWSELNSGLRPAWSGLIGAFGFLLGVLAFLFVPKPKSLQKKPQKKSGAFTAPDDQIDRIPDGI